MAPQNESDQKPGNDEVKAGSERVAEPGSGSTDLASQDKPVEYFSDDDEFSASRFAALSSETTGLLQQVQLKPDGLKDATPEQLRNLYQDAEERQGWSQARQDGFIGLLRLGRPTPPRAARVL